MVGASFATDDATAARTLGLFDGFGATDWTRLLPFEIVRDELEASLGYALGIARLSVHVRRPEQEKSTQTVRPVEKKSQKNILKEKQFSARERRVRVKEAGVCQPARNNNADCTSFPEDNSWRTADFSWPVIIWGLRAGQGEINRPGAFVTGRPQRERVTR